MNLPSNRYFESVKTEEDYKRFKATGMAYEWEINCPSSWQEHLQMVEFKKKKEYYDNVKNENFEASMKLEGM